MTHPYRRPPHRVPSEGVLVSLAPRWTFLALSAAAPPAVVVTALVCFLSSGWTRLVVLPCLPGLLLASIPLLRFLLRPRRVLVAAEHLTFFHLGRRPVRLAREEVALSTRGRWTITFDAVGSLAWSPRVMSAVGRRAVVDAFTTFLGYDILEPTEAARRLARPAGGFGAAQRFQGLLLEDVFGLASLSLVPVVFLALVGLPIEMVAVFGLAESLPVTLSMLCFAVRRVEVHAGGVAFTYLGGREVRLTRDDVRVELAGAYIFLGAHRVVESSCGSDALSAALSALVGYDVTNPHGEARRLHEARTAGAVAVGGVQ